MRRTTPSLIKDTNQLKNQNQKRNSILKNNAISAIIKTSVHYSTSKPSPKEFEEAPQKSGEDCPGQWALIFKSGNTPKYYKAIARKK